MRGSLRPYRRLESCLITLLSTVLWTSSFPPVSSLSFPPSAKIFWVNWIVRSTVVNWHWLQLEIRNPISSKEELVVESPAFLELQRHCATLVLLKIIAKGSNMTITPALLKSLRVMNLKFTPGRFTYARSIAHTLGWGTENVVAQ